MMIERDRVNFELHSGCGPCQGGGPTGFAMTWKVLRIRLIRATPNHPVLPICRLPQQNGRQWQINKEMLGGMQQQSRIGSSRRRPGGIFWRKIGGKCSRTSRRKCKQGGSGTATGWRLGSRQNHLSRIHTEVECDETKGRARKGERGPISFALRQREHPWVTVKRCRKCPRMAAERRLSF